MDLYGVFFGIWFGVGCYRLFEMFEIDTMNAEEGYNEAEEYGISQGTYMFFSCISAFGWPVLMPYAYLVARDEDEDEG